MRPVISTFVKLLRWFPGGPGVIYSHPPSRIDVMEYSLFWPREAATRVVSQKSKTKARDFLKNHFRSTVHRNGLQFRLW